MDVFRIIEKEGYRFEDLNKQNQDVITWLRYLRKDFESFGHNLDAYCDMLDDGSTLSQIEMEVADKVISGVKLWLDVQIADYQITLIEGQE